MEYINQTENIKIIVKTEYDKSKSGNSWTYYKYSVTFKNNSNDNYTIIGRKLTVRPNSFGEAKDITLDSLSRSVRGSTIPANGEYSYDTFSSNNGPVSIRGCYVLENTRTKETLFATFPLTFFPLVDYDLAP